MGNTNSVLLGLITDVVALLAGYIINFVGCDLIYHNFDIQQSIKGSYWFFLEKQDIGIIWHVVGFSRSLQSDWLKFNTNGHAVYCGTKFLRRKYPIHAK